MKRVVGRSCTGDAVLDVTGPPGQVDVWPRPSACDDHHREDRVPRLQAVLTLLGSLADCTCTDLAQCADRLRAPVWREKARPGRQRGG